MIEDRYGLTPLTDRDKDALSMSNSLDLSQTPIEPFLITQPI